MKRFILFIVTMVVTCLQLQSQTIYSLNDCRQMAIKHNKDLLIANENVKAANSLRKAAKTQYLPNFSANGGYVHNQKNISLLGADQYLPVYATKADGSLNFASSVNNGWTVINGSYVPLDASGNAFDPTKNPEKILWKNYAYIPKDAFEFDTHNVWAGSILMTQPLFMGGKIRELNRIAESSKHIAEAQYEGQTSETIFDTDAAYWRVVSLANKEKLAKSYLELLKKLDNDVSKSIDFGVATKSDGLSVKVKLNEAEMSLLQVQDGLSLSRMALCQQCGLPLDNEFQLADENISLLPQNAVSVTDNDDKSIEKRYEIKSLESMVNIAKSNEKIQLSRFLPNIGLTAGYLTTNPNMYNGYEKEFSGQWQIGVVANVPLFHWGERIHTLRASENEKNIAQYKLDDAKEKIKLDVTQAKFKISEASKKAKMTAYNKTKAEENLKYATIGFESGTVASSTLMEAQTAWLKANSEDIDAQIDVQLCQVYLQKALGILN
ncbi:MAG: TolC family protein [Bacteroidales bacterium]|nr:TolC family protein [Bacteroidales bacterium]